MSLFLSKSYSYSATPTDALKGLGARHVKYGTLPEHYPLVGSTLLKTFEQYLDTDWTSETKQAWTDAYTAITSLMLDGAGQGENAMSTVVHPTIL